MATIGHLVKTVTTAGVAERLSATDLWVSYFLIQSLETNNDQVYGGGSTVSSSSYGFYLSAAGAAAGKEQGGLGFATQVNLKDIWIDVGTGGQGGSVFYVQS